jgi:hypothetical protein
VGDVRSRSIKWVAAAVGEGWMAVRLVHEHLNRSGFKTETETSDSNWLAPAAFSCRRRRHGG